MTRRLSPISILLLIGAVFFLFVLRVDIPARFIALTSALLLSSSESESEDESESEPVRSILGVVNAMLIERLGGYDVLFPAAATVDGQLSGLGVGVVVWYIATWIAFLKGTSSKSRS